MTAKKATKRKKPRLLDFRPVAYTRVEGGTIFKWGRRGAPGTVHSIFFKDGSAFDTVNGWRKDNAGGVDYRMARGYRKPYPGDWRKRPHLKEAITNAPIEPGFETFAAQKRAWLAKRDGGLEETSREVTRVDGGVLVSTTYAVPRAVH